MTLMRHLSVPRSPPTAVVDINSALHTQSFLGLTLHQSLAGLADFMLSIISCGFLSTRNVASRCPHLSHFVAISWNSTLYSSNIKIYLKIYLLLNLTWKTAVHNQQFVLFWNWRLGNLLPSTLTYNVSSLRKYLLSVAFSYVLGVLLPFLFEILSLILVIFEHLTLASFLLYWYYRFIWDLYLKSYLYLN